MVVLVCLLAGCRQLLDFEHARIEPDAAPDATACADSDRDAVCDEVDDWPCGPDPGPVAATVIAMGNGGKTVLTITGVAVANGQRVFDAGAMLDVTFSYDLQDTSCASNCIDQIEIGYAPGDRVACPYDAPVPRTTGASGDLAVPMTAPGSGAYEIRINIGQNLSCTEAGANTWWESPPTAANTIARICVR